MDNHLINETSPYLLQHAHNPVDWYPWGEEALRRARDEDKPILVSIGYAACHWCHVMERESFEDAETAALMNRDFINIKIDREERPDLDHIYMDAVQAMSGSGGWPLNVFLTPDKKPFYGGTYFPPRPVSGRPSWKDVLTGVASAFSNRRDEIEQQANGLTGHLQQTNNFGIRAGAAEGLQQADADAACMNLLQQADTVWGGFGRAPKFPQTFSIQYLLRYYALERNRAESHAAPALQQALLSLDKMIDGGIYDQAGGGFARYSTDTEWLAPHFEKMLYDNALLVSVLSEAYAITKNEKYSDTIKETLAFVQRELTDVSGGFYAALDADSEGEEGRFYVWNKDEVGSLLGADADIFCRYCDITAQGNWEGKNILRVLQSPEAFAMENNIEVSSLRKIIERGKQILLKARRNRIRPLLDDKIILGWNALMNTAYSKAYAATAQEDYKNRAVANMYFLLSAFETTGDGFRHVWKNGTAKYPAFLDDLAYLVQALLQLHRVTADKQWLLKAKEITALIIKDFSENNSPFFYYTPVQQQDVILRKREVYDGATPSGNAVMAQNLYELGILFDETEWKERATAMISSLQNMAVKYPASFGLWLAAAYQVLKGTDEIVLLGDYEKAMHELLQQYLPHSIMMAANGSDDAFPLLKDKVNTAALTLYLCHDYACLKPVHTPGEFLTLLNSNK